MKRTAEFSDGVCLDDGSGLDKMEEVMKKSTMKSIKTSHAAPSPFLAGSCSFVTLFLFLLFIFLCLDSILLYVPVKNVGWYLTTTHI